MNFNYSLFQILQFLNSVLIFQLSNYFQYQILKCLLPCLSYTTILDPGDTLVNKITKTPALLKLLIQQEKTNQQIYQVVMKKKKGRSDMLMTGLVVFARLYRYNDQGKSLQQDQIPRDLKEVTIPIFLQEKHFRQRGKSVKTLRFWVTRVINQGAVAIGQAKGDMTQVTVIAGKIQNLFSFASQIGFGVGGKDVLWMTTRFWLELFTEKGKISGGTDSFNISFDIKSVFIGNRF